MTLTDHIKAMNQAIEDKAQGLSYREMMQTPEIVALIARRDALLQERDKAQEQAILEYVDENPELSEILDV